MEHEPCALLLYGEILGKLVRAYAVLAVGDKPHGGKLFVQAERRILEDGPDLDAELLLARAALPHAAGFQVVVLGIYQTALRADRTIGPAEFGDELCRHVQIGEITYRF
jgi:hypothetical protein